MSDLAVKVNDLLSSLEISESQLATLLETSQATVNRIRRGCPPKYAIGARIVALHKVQCGETEEPAREDLSKLHQRIVYVRIQAGLTRRQLYTMIGVTQQALDAWERGKVENLEMRNLFALADATGFSARWIALGTP